MNDELPEAVQNALEDFLEAERHYQKTTRDMQQALNGWLEAQRALTTAQVQHLLNKKNT